VIGTQPSALCDLSIINQQVLVTRLLNLFDIYRGLSEAQIARHITSRATGGCQTEKKGIIFVKQVGQTPV
jgi:hypothetical protein